MILLSPWMWRLAAASHLSLIVLILLRSWGSAGALMAVPLVFPVPGILRRREYTCAWASMLLAFYAAIYLANGYADPAERFEHFALATVAALDFVGLTLFVRFRARERASAPAARKED